MAGLGVPQIHEDESIFVLHQNDPNCFYFEIFVGFGGVRVYWPYSLTDQTTSVIDRAAVIQHRFPALRNIPVCFGMHGFDQGPLSLRRGFTLGFYSQFIIQGQPMLSINRRTLFVVLPFPDRHPVTNEPQFASDQQLVLGSRPYSDTVPAQTLAAQGLPSNWDWRIQPLTAQGLLPAIPQGAPQNLMAGGIVQRPTGGQNPGCFSFLGGSSSSSGRR